MTPVRPDEQAGKLAQEDELQDLELAPRPRRRLLAPIPLSLLAVVLVAAGFVAGAHVEKGHSASAGATSAFAGTSAPSALGASAATAGKGSSAGNSASPSREDARPTSGKVASRSGKTLYVKGSEGATVKVATSAATTVTKTVKAKVKAIHPGETVTVTGSTDSKGALSAESISVGSSRASEGSLGAG